ncbi:hypothetical protein K4A83_21980 [Spirulina subsalsa FACHB-351]|uniref:Uncharacterized protein n=1 Tax=Spirulina subsalsa FACHB-351 TaxID=234711 RepID=A0ABT3LD44_9CYAN|nr:hypothetical protein [Spirulina subsalsa]MCW6038905.1 hypothetical protein [Spirulina subsalsa FACHB-351]
MTKLESLRCSGSDFDGLMVYWLDVSLPETILSQTGDGKPLIWVMIAQLDELRVRGQEFKALQALQKAPELQNDGVARREVKQRLVEAKRLLDETFTRSLSWSTGDNSCWVNGEQVEIHSRREFQSRLSDLCDRVYSQCLILDNELINRRELTPSKNFVQMDLEQFIGV